MTAAAVPEPVVAPSGRVGGDAGGAGAPRRRSAYLDNLKVVLVAGVIVGHALITYASIGSWLYREPSANEAFNVIAAVLVSCASLFAMGLFFLIAGLLTPAPFRRKGTRRFLLDRALRLGLPFAAFLLVIPVLEWVADGTGRPLSGYLIDQVAVLDPGPLWFVAVLLVYSVGYAAWRAMSPAPQSGERPMPVWVLPGAAAAIAVGSLLVRLQFPIDSSQLFAAHLWQWPQCLTLFVLGVVAAERGWLVEVTGRQRHISAAVAVVALAVVLTAIATSDGPEAFAGGPTWQAALTAACEGALAVSLSVWLLSLFQRRFNHAGPLARALGRAAFGAYLVQAPVLVVVAVMAHGLPAAPEVKALLVAPAAVVGAFALAWVLTRVPGVRRLL